MGDDISRNTFDPIKRHQSVRLQQGRVWVDADFNEQVDIVNHRLKGAFADLVGPTGAPKHGGGFAIEAQNVLEFDGQAAAFAAPHVDLRFSDGPFVLAVRCAPRPGCPGGTLLCATDARGHTQLSLRVDAEGGVVVHRHGARALVAPARWAQARTLRVASDGDVLRLSLDDEHLDNTQLEPSARAHGHGHGHAREHERLPVSILVGMGLVDGEHRDGFHGSIEWVRIWGGADETAPLLVRWELDEGADLLAADRSGRGHHLQLDHGRTRARPRWHNRSLTISPGRFYVDGLVCTAHQRTPLLAKDRSASAAPSAGDALPAGGVSLVYLDAWERSISAFEDSSLRDPALGGVDTATRVRLEQRVRTLWVSPDALLEFDSREVQHAWQHLIRAHAQSGTMRVRSREPDHVPNAYYRVEIQHSGGGLEAGDAAHASGRARALEKGGRTIELLDAPGREWLVGQWCASAGFHSRVVGVSPDGRRLELERALPDTVGLDPFPLRALATFKWSRNNAADKWSVQQANGRGLVIVEVPWRRLAVGDLVEVSDERLRSDGAPGFIATVKGVSDGGRIVLDEPLPALGERIVLVRWHGGRLLPVSLGWTELEHGIDVEFGGRSSYSSGEGWGFAAREVDGSVDWPLEAPGGDASERPAAAEPAWRSPHDGHHHHAPLALLQRHGGGVLVRDLRRVFAPLGVAPSSADPFVVETLSHVGRQTQIDDGVIGSRQLASDVGVVPPGASILSDRAQPPPGFAHTHATIRVPEPEPVWRPAHHRPEALAGRVVLLGVADGVLALVERGLVWHANGSDGRWRAIAEMPSHRVDFAAAVRGSDVHLVGGRDATGVPVAHHSVLRGSEWQQRAPLRVARANLALGSLDGTLFAAGGTRSAFYPWRLRDRIARAGLSSWWYPERTTASVEVYDDERDEWLAAPSMPLDRAAMAVTVRDGCLHLLGGRSVPLIGEPRLCADHLEYMPSIGRWTTRTPLRRARALSAAAVLDGVIYVLGGEDDDGPIATVESLAAAGDAWRSSALLPQPRTGAGLAALSGELLCAGGGGLSHDAEPVVRCTIARTFFVHERVGSVDRSARRLSERPSLPAAAPASSEPAVATPVVAPAPAPATGAAPAPAPAAAAAVSDASAPPRPVVPTLAMPSPARPAPLAAPAAPPAVAPSAAIAAPASASASASTSGTAPAPASAPASAPGSAPTSSLRGVVTHVAPPKSTLALPASASKAPAGLRGRLAALGTKAKQAAPVVAIGAVAGLVGSGNLPHVLDSAREQLIVWLTPANGGPTAATAPSVTGAAGAGAGAAAAAAPGVGGASSVPTAGSSGAPVAPGGSGTPDPLDLGDPAADYARGVDVSHYQATVPWQTLATNGISYAYTKATEGTGYRDPRFSSNWASMKAHGILRGAYHMWHPDEDPVAQAKFFVSVVGTGSDLPPVIDIELMPSKTDCPTLLGNILAFVESVEQQLGCVGALYSYRRYWLEHLSCTDNPSASAITQALAQRPLWIADYSSTDAPELFGGRDNWAFWQYTDQGNAAGDHFDLDRFAGTPDALRGWIDDLKRLGAWQQGRKR